MDDEIEICEQCGGDVKRVGLFNCDDGHPVPNLAQRIARAIENDLNDRRGLHLSSLDDERRNDIVDTWETLIEPIVAAAMRSDTSTTKESE